MPRITLPQRAFWVTLITAAAPYAFFRLTRKPTVPFAGNLTLSEADVYDDLHDGEVAAAG